VHVARALRHSTGLRDRLQAGRGGRPGGGIAATSFRGAPQCCGSTTSRRRAAIIKWHWYT